jgi:hypothetical protein
MNQVARMLALLVFVSCGISAFCLGAMSYMYVTGDLPFEITPLFYVSPTPEKGDKTTEKKDETKKDESGRGSQMRLNEKYLLNYFDDLKQEKEKISVKQEKLAVKEKVAQEINTQAIKMQDQVAQFEKKIKDLLEEVKQKEAENITQMATLIAALDTQAATRLLTDMDEQLASRIFYFMTKTKKKIAAQILSLMLKSADTDISSRAQLLTDNLQVLIENDQKKGNKK